MSEKIKAFNKAMQRGKSLLNAEALATPQSSETCIKRKSRHGMSNTRFYRTFTQAKERCTNPKYKKWYLYGGKGIRFRWKTFEDFRDDMLTAYEAHVTKYGEKNTTIDRIDSNGDYCKENCRWATHSVNNGNRCISIPITIDGETHHVAEWARIKGLHPKTVYNRMRHSSPEWSLSEKYEPHSDLTN